MDRLRWLSTLVSVAFLLPAWSARADPASAPVRRLPIEVRTGDYLSPEQMSGEGYTVGRKAVSDGFVNVYTIETEWGRDEIVSTEGLLNRINEIKAAYELEALKRSSVMADAVKDGAISPAKGAVELAKSPLGATTGAGKGMGRWLGNVGRSTVSGDPDQEGVVSALVGYAGAKRAYALGFGVDPWTDFEPVQKRLGEIARAAVGAGLATAVVMAEVTPDNDFGLAVDVLGISNELNQMLADESAAQIRSVNKKKLRKMGVPSYAADAFMRNYNYTPMQHSILVETLQSMGEIRGREIFVAHATAAPSPDVARYGVLVAQMAARYVEKVEKADFIQVADYPWLRSRSGKIVVMMPVDRLFWTAELANAELQSSRAIRKLPRVTGKQLWLEGRADPTARKALESRGWTVRERVRLTPRGSLSQKKTASGG